ncbi:MAG: hypothetical protein ACRDVZ_11720, partial [Jiangellaceae bacterium]
MDYFRSRGAPLEYWFVKVISGDLAFLVDWIVRRDSALAEVRISMWVRRIGRVLRSQSGGWREDRTGVEICGCTFTSAGSQAPSSPSVAAHVINHRPISTPAPRSECKTSLS